VLLCVLLMWVVFVCGAALVLETVYPGTLEEKLGELKTEIGETGSAVGMLKEKVGGLVEYVEALRGSEQEVFGERDAVTEMEEVDEVGEVGEAGEVGESVVDENGWEM
jgi:hypothetical protein